MPKPPEEPELDCVVATDWSYPSQRLWTRQSVDAWVSESSHGYLSWEELCEEGELTILTPSDSDAFDPLLDGSTRSRPRTDGAGRVAEDLQAKAHCLRHLRHTLPK